MLFKLIIVFLCTAYVTADLVNSRNCNMTNAIESSDQKMYVTNCTTEHEECRLKRGEVYQVINCFTPTSNFTEPAKMQFKVKGVFSRYSVQHGRTKPACPSSRVSDTETCNNHGGIFIGRQWCHYSTFSVRNSYPCLKLRVKFLIQTRRPVRYMMCQEVSVEIVEADDQP